MTETSTKIDCYYCGADLASLSLPIGRLDMCPACNRYLHVCRMCKYFDPNETSKQCSEDDAEKVQDKKGANFCDFYTVTAGAYDSAELGGNSIAKDALSALFGDAEPAATDHHADTKSRNAIDDAESLFKK